MKKLFTLFLALAAGAGTLFAWDYERIQIDDLYYNLDASTQTAEVTSQNSSSPYWSTAITTANIPASMNYNEITYSVTSIGNRAFQNCSGLTSVTIPNSVTSIGNNAFWNCSGLTSVTIPNSITSIGNEAFYKCTGLTSMTIPNSVTTIEEWAFSGCSGLTSIDVAADNPNYSSEEGVLFNKDKTTLVAYPGGKQGAYAIPNSVTSIGVEAFGSCTGLTSVTIPNSVTSIGDYAFHGCSGLTSVTIPNSVTIIGEGAFSSCSGLTSVTIPNRVTRIESSAFYGCTGLTSVTIPNSVTSIGDYAFGECSGLTSVTIPNSVTIIGNLAFYQCSGLTSVTNYATTPQTIDSYVFDNVDKSTCKLYVPIEAVSAYQAANVWKEFSNIVGIDVLEEDPGEPIDTIDGDYTIYYVDNESKNLSDEVVTLHVPVAPTITGFSFLKWIVVGGDLEDGITIQAVYKADIPSAMPAVYSNPANPVQKLIRNGNVYLLTDDKTYTITGRTVR